MLDFVYKKDLLFFFSIYNTLIDLTLENILKKNVIFFDLFLILFWKKKSFFLLFNRQHTNRPYIKKYIEIKTNADKYRKAALGSSCSGITSLYLHSFLIPHFLLVCHKSLAVKHLRDFRPGDFGVSRWYWMT